METRATPSLPKSQTLSASQKGPFRHLAEYKRERKHGRSSKPRRPSAKSRSPQRARAGKLDIVPGAIECGGRQSAFNRLSPKKRGLRRFPEGGTPYTGRSLDVSEKVWVAHAARSVRSHRNMAQSRISPEGSASGSLSSGFTNIVEPILDPSAGCPPLILRHVGVLLPKTLTFGNGGLCGILRRGIGAPRIGPATRGRRVSCVRVCGEISRWLRRGSRLRRC